MYYIMKDRIDYIALLWVRASAEGKRNLKEFLHAMRDDVGLAELERLTENLTK